MGSCISAFCEGDGGYAYDTEYQRNHRVPTFQSAGPLFGEYKCHCGRRWASRLSWRNCYQICKRCRRTVYPHTQRQLLRSDMTSSDITQEHPIEFCGRCKQLGTYCGNPRNRRNNKHM